MLKKIMVTVVVAGLLFSGMQALSLRAKSLSLREALLHPSGPLAHRARTGSLDRMHTDVTKLNLGSRGITKITLEEGRALAENYPELEELDLSLNKLKTLPDGVFSGLRNLRVLNLSYNRLRKVNDWGFGGMPNLRELSLAGNFIRRTLHEVLRYHRNGPLDQMHATVRWLDLHQSELASISEEEGKLLAKNYPNLLELNLSLNHLSILPAGVLSRLTKLKVLDLSSCLFTTLPSGIFRGMTRLEELSLFGNELTTLPPEMFGGMSPLISLRELDLGRNRFSARYIAKAKEALPWVTIMDGSRQKVYLGEE